MSKLDDAIAAAVTQAQTELGPSESDDAEGTAAVEATAPEPSETPGAAQSTTPGSTEVTTDVESEAEDEEVPTSLFGIDLSVLPDEATRAEFIREWREQNKTISRLQREKAELEKAMSSPKPPEPPEPESPSVAEFTDEAIAEALGLDPEDDSPAAKAAIALARGFMELKEQVTGVVTAAEVSETERYWESTLDYLESKYGELPIDRTELLEYAAEHEITDPEVAYWAKMGPIRFDVSQALDRKLKEVRARAKKAATTPRPTTSTPVGPTPLRSKTVKDAIREAFVATAHELGIDIKG